MKYAAIEKHAGGIGKAKACALLGVRRQGFYEWRHRCEGRRQREDREITEQLKKTFYSNDKIYGARKLIKKAGLSVGRKRVRRLMDAAGLIPVTRRKRMNTTESNHPYSVFTNLLQQNFKEERINRVWASDFTYIATDEGWLYLCSIIDLCSRRVIGWAVSNVIDRELAIQAFRNAVQVRDPAPGFIFHTDRGSQYASEDFRNTVAACGGIQSMSAKGCPYDNACAESFFKSLKVECLYRHRFFTRQQASDAIARYMLFYNRQRIHATIGYLSPADYEASLPLAS